MEVVKKTDDYTIYKKKSGRFCVQGANKKWINGEEKVKILLAESLIKAPAPKAKEEPEAKEVEAAAQESTEEASAPEESSEEAAPAAE